MRARFISLLVAVSAVVGACSSGGTARPVVPAPSSRVPSASPSSPPGVLIAAAGDIACSIQQRATPSDAACAEPQTATLLEDLSPEAILALGDLQYENGGINDFRASFGQTWGRFKAKIRPVPGNHDWGTKSAAGYFTYFGSSAGTSKKSYYSFDLGGWHLIALDSNCPVVGGCDAGSPQEKWLRADLAANDATCTLAFWHHPRFSSGLHGSDARFVPFWRALAEAGADVVLSGHDHHYERFAPQDADGKADPARGIRQFVAGTGGRNLYAVLSGRANSEFRTSRSFGLLLLELKPASYEYRFVNIDGKVLDSGSGACH